MDMKVTPKNLLNLVKGLSKEACSYHGIEEDKAYDLTMGQFTEFLEEANYYKSLSKDDTSKVGFMNQFDDFLEEKDTKKDIISDMLKS